MLIKTSGIVFRQQKYGDTSVILDVYTQAVGMRSYILHGVRKARSRIPISAVQVMSMIDLVAYDRSDKALNRVKEVKTGFIYQSIPFNVIKGAVGLFMVEVARKTIREEEPNEGLYRYLCNSFQWLDQQEGPIGNFHLYFLCGLSQYLGFFPDGQCTPETPYFDLQEGSFVAQAPRHPNYLQEEHSAILGKILRSDALDCCALRMQRQDRQILLRNLLDFYRLHLASFPEIQAYRVLETVLR
ncbi:MAG: DNA repair protein RecO [Bacteroidota bacterium]